MRYLEIEVRIKELDQNTGVVRETWMCDTIECDDPAGPIVGGALAGIGCAVRQAHAKGVA